MLYRVAEMLEGRRDAVRRRGRGGRGRRRPTPRARRSTTSIDRFVWYAGWADKFAQVAGSANPVAGPYFNFSLPEPTGVVAIVAPQESSLLGLVSALAPVLVTGNTAVVVASERRPLPAVSLAEVLATSDLPGGVVNVLTGFTRRARALAREPPRRQRDRPHRRRAPTIAPSCSARRPTTSSACTPRRDEDWAAEPGTERLTAFVETKTVWHPIGV